MNTKTFVIATTGDRVEGLKKLLVSLYPFFKTGWRALVVAQKYSSKSLMDIKSMFGNDVHIFAYDKLIGAHTAKMVAINSVRSNIWCSLDDDMCAIPSTNYDRIAEILDKNRSIGFISGNWARTFKQANKKELQDKLINQKLVFTGGGLLFRDDVADIVRKIPNEQYLFDDCLWAMYAYINGYSNYRYLGSVAVHQICTNGGRRSWLKESNNRVLPPVNFLRVRKSTDLDGYYICKDSDLTELAHIYHKNNLKN